MGSQTLEILRQGVWASLTGGYFYDPHQSVCCNIVHLYIWLYLLCSPFVAYLYFPSTWLTWCIYCVSTSFTILLVKLANMALHRLYDRAQTMSEANLKNQFFKITKETEPRDDDTGIEMKVMSVNGSRNSVEQAINEACEENSMLSIENVNSIIDLKVDVHRKNSSESIELMFYAPSIMSSSSQQDQQSLAGSTSVSKSIRSTSGAANTNSAGEVFSKYLAVYPEHSEGTGNNANAHGSNISGGGMKSGGGGNLNTMQGSDSRRQHLSRKCSEVFHRRHHRRRLERQSSFDAAAGSTFGSRLMRNQSDTITTTSLAITSGSNSIAPGINVIGRNETFLHSQVQSKQNSGTSNSNITATINRTSSSRMQIASTANVVLSVAATTTTSAVNSGSGKSLSVSSSSGTSGARTSRLQRHRSSETHEERLKHQRYSFFQPVYHHPGSMRNQLTHTSSGASSIGALADSSIADAEDIELGLGGSSSGVTESGGRTLQSWILDSSSDVYLEDDSYTKSDLGIEQLEMRNNLQQPKSLNSQYQRSGHHRLHHLGTMNIRKDSASTMSALQLSVASGVNKTNATNGNGAGVSTISGGMKRRRHSNVTTYKNNTQTPKSAVSSNIQHSVGVRRIKSAALEIPTAQTSVSNLSPHPNSVEAINGGPIQMRNPLPPPSKTLVRNHLNLGPRLIDQSFTDSSRTYSSLNFGASSSVSGSTTALIEPPVYPIVEHSDEKASLDLTNDELELADIDGEADVDIDKDCNRITDEIKKNCEPSLNYDNETDTKFREIDIDDHVDDVPLDRTRKTLGCTHSAEFRGIDIDDHVDDVPLERIRKTFGCTHSAESDVGGILADDDDDDDCFKDFDDNLENILSELQQTQNQLDDVLKDNQNSQQNDLKPNIETPIMILDDDDDDDETDNNNGSRSPLLSVRNRLANACETAADKAMSNEIAASQSVNSTVASNAQQANQSGIIRSEADSGCPSSDCEQISASSKDQLLVSIKNPEDKCSNTDQNLMLPDIEKPSTSKMAAGIRNLGAIPKAVKYQEDSDLHVEQAENNNSSYLYKRRGGRHHEVHPFTTNTTTSNNQIDLALVGVKQQQNKVLASTYTSSSSNSSHSISAENLSADIHKMLWLMHGGAVDERGRPIAGITADGTPIPAHPNIVPPNMSNAHFQFYQDAIQALHSTYPSSSIEQLTHLERTYFRDKLRRDSKQISEPAVDFAATVNTTIPHAVTSTASLSHTPAIGMLMPSSSAAALNARQNMSTTAALSLQGLINVIRSERGVARPGIDGMTHVDSVTAVGAAMGEGISVSASNAATNNPGVSILNVEGHHLGPYCDFWRPACLLSAEKPVVPKSYYKYHFKCCGYEREFKISMDRLQLLALFDRDLHWIHVLLSFVLCTIVAYLGALILQHNYYKDLFAFLFCAVIASAQYSLVKSVQPDAASPIHGFNKTVAYSRAIYFSLYSSVLLLLKRVEEDYHQHPPSELVFFGMRYSPLDVTAGMLQFLYIVLLCFPLIFSLGLFPQINTFVMYLLEQIDMHVFGGNAASSLLGSFICVLRSILAILLLYGPLYAALAESYGTQYIVFSIFCAMLIPLGYHLSRSASDFSHIWRLIKTCIVSTYRDDDDEVSATSATNSQNMATSTPKSSSKQKQKRQRGIIKNVANKNNLSTNSNENIELSSLEKLPMRTEYESQRRNLERKNSKSKNSSLDSSQTLAKTISSSKKVITASSSYTSISAAADLVACNEDSNTAQPSADSEIIGAINNETEMVNSDANKQNSRQENSLDTIDKSNVTEEQTNNSILDTKAKTQDFLDSDPERASTSSTTNPGDISTLTAGGGTVADAVTIDAPAVFSNTAAAENDLETELPDPLPKKLQNTVNTRLKNDIVVMTLLAVSIFGLHSSTVFTVLQPDLNIVLYAFTGALGMLLHYIIPQMRKHMPWLCFARPILRQKEYGQFEVSSAPKIMWFEKVYIYLCLMERNVLFPLLAISSLTADSQVIVEKFGVPWGTLIVAVCALKFVRNSYSDPTNQYLIIIFTVLLFRIDFAVATETFIIDYFFVSLAFRKCCDFFLKLQFIVTYIAPWQITWGSAFHAFAQPFSVPHSAMLFLQAGVSAILSTPLNPFLGSAIFLTSYVRPIKFWERDYNTRRIDHSNTRLSSQLERDLGADDNNLNSIFYEHLTRSLQHSLCGDLLMGRWGSVNQGDCFVLASDYLNCLVHIIELGNGLCTFQMRGLEFRGTYCQQREVEAITEGVEDNDGCCCCDPGHLPRLLSANAMFSTRWLAWQVVAAQYVLEGYSISDNLASATLQVFEYRKVLITYYIKSIIYYVIKNPKLEQWLAPGPIQDALQHTLSRQFVDLDPIFNFNLDEDFDFRAVGITRSSFCYVYLKWINFCIEKRKEVQMPQEVTQTQATAPSVVANAGSSAVGQTSSENAAGAYNDSKSTPNLSTHCISSSQSKSQSQQQLLSSRPQKSATLGGSATVNNTTSSSEMASSHSFANISRQTSESAPGLNCAGLKMGCVSYMDNNTVYNAQAAVVVGGAKISKPQSKTLRKDESPHANRHDSNNVTSSTYGAGTRDNPQLKLKVLSVAKDAPLVSLCLALGLLARRSLATASHSSLTGVEFFLHGLHALFKGDFRITSPRDEWVFADMELLHSVVAPAVKMALKLQQDHISNPDEFLDPNALYEAIDTCSKELVISHEADPVWRSAVLRGAPNLLALRHVMEDGSDEYRIIRLTKRFLSFRVIKLNRECVRGLWAGQQQELIYLRNRNPERGSIQNAKQALRNIINSSCDQPIGYPIYVSPLTTSYADTNEQLCEVIGGAITLESIKSTVYDWCNHIRERCRQGCSSGSALEASNLGVCNFGSGIGTGSVGGGGGSGGGSGIGGTAGPVLPTGSVGSESANDLAPVFISAPLYNTLTVNNYFGVRSGNVGSSLSGTYVSESLAVVRGGLAVMPVKPTSTTYIAGLLNREREQERNTNDIVTLREIPSIRGGNSGQRKSGNVSRNTERERRATLPIANTSSVSTTTGGAVVISESKEQNNEQNNDCADVATTSHYTKISSSSGCLGIGNIITTPGEYPRKTKGPICLTASTLASEHISRSTPEMTPRKPRIEIFRKVIIVDDTEIYDCLDIIDAVIWPNEHMRSNGGRVSWKDWEPTAGMVGYVVHCWIPNHSDPRFRSHVNRIVYLIEIGNHYVPIEELGLREYNQIMGSSEEMANSRRSSIQREFDEYNLQLKLAGLTPILGSSLESNKGTQPKIRAVSSTSSSEDETEAPPAVNMKNFSTLLNMWKLIADSKKLIASIGSEQLSTDEFEGFDYDNEAHKIDKHANDAQQTPADTIKGVVAASTEPIFAETTYTITEKNEYDHENKSNQATNDSQNMEPQTKIMVSEITVSNETETTAIELPVNNDINDVIVKKPPTEPATELLAAVQSDVFESITTEETIMPTTTTITSAVAITQEQATNKPQITKNYASEV